MTNETGESRQLCERLGVTQSMGATGVCPGKRRHQSIRCDGVETAPTLAWLTNVAVSTTTGTPPRS
jgi:hypothetical protein